MKAPVAVSRSVPSVCVAMVRRSVRPILAGFLVSVAAACTDRTLAVDSEDLEDPVRRPDAAYRLSEHQQSLLRRTLDPAKVEHFLSYFTPEERAEIFALFVPAQDQAMALAYFPDHTVAPLYEDIWADHWMSLSAEEFRARDQRLAAYTKPVRLIARTGDRPVGVTVVHSADAEDRIYVPADAQEGDIMEALRALMRSRALLGTRPSLTTVIVIEGVPTLQETEESGNYRRARQWLEALRSRTATESIPAGTADAASYVIQPGGTQPPPGWNVARERRADSGSSERREP